jgi:RimJ/RimL family protein N-acetyltransferase
MPEPVVALRPSTAGDDAAQISWVGAAEDVERFAGPSLRFPLTSEQLQAHRDDPAIATFTAFVAPDEATPIGRIDLVRLSPTEGRISRVVVDPARRGQGLARSVVACAIAAARDAGITKLELHVFADNVPALRVYERLGFTISGPAPRDARQVTMRLALGAS